MAKLKQLDERVVRGSPDPCVVRGSPDPARNQPAAGNRLLSLDAFRGLTILAMILVNNPGTWEKGARYWPLDHAEWHGWTPTDLIFPFFLFIVGTSLAYSLRKYHDGQRISPAVYARIVRRTLVLILLGLLPGILTRVCDYIFGDASAIDFSTLRYTGVLQRIALVYFVVSLIALHFSVRSQAAFAVVALLGYWAVLGLLPHPGNYEGNLSPDGNVAGLVDRTVFTPPHMYTYDRETNTLREQTEPEGVLSTFPAIVTSLLGYWVGLAIQRLGFNFTTVLILLGCGAVAVEAGLLWDLVFPINKKIWTSSYVLLTGGLAMQLLAACFIVCDGWGWRRFARPFEIVGINAIFVFVASGLMAILLRNMTIGAESAHDWIYHHLFTSWTADPRLASLGFALAVVAFWWFVCWVMSRLGWVFRV
jgi:predicted acyltransferase